MNEASLLQVLELIEKGTLSERNQAIDQLQNFPFDDIKNTLFDGLGSNHHRLRAQCAKLIAERGDETVILPLLHLVSEESFVLRESARDALLQLPEDLVIPALAGIVESSSGSATMISAIVDILAKSSHPDSTAILIKMFENSAESEIIEKITKALGKKQDEQSIKQLFHLFAHELWIVRKSAVSAIMTMPWAKVSDHLVKGLGNPNRFIHLATIEILVARSNDEVIDIMDEILRGDSVTAKLNALSVLSGIGTDESMSLMLAVLGDPNTLIRNKTIQELGKTRSDTLLNQLQRCLTSSNDSLKCGAIRVLGVIGTNEAIDILEKLMESPSEDIKICAMKSLATIASRRSIKLLLQHSTMPERAGDVIGILKDLDPDLSIKKIVNLLDEPDFFSIAMNTLQEFEVARVLRSLVSKLNAGNPTQQKKAVEAMGFLGAKEALPYLESILNGSYSDDITVSAERAIRQLSAEK
jgi:HEAT repeat protein